MRWWAALLLASPLVAQTTTVRGVLLEWEGSEQGGVLSVRGSDHYVRVFVFDGLTRFQRDTGPISVTQLRTGDTLEVTAAPGAESRRRHATLVRVIATPPPQRPAFPARWRAFSSRFDSMFPRGNLTLAGLVADVGAERLRLRTRTQGEQTILLRHDTRYFCDGSPASLSELKVNTRVFVRAGKTFENELEAFQVVWGRILRP